MIGTSGKGKVSLTSSRLGTNKDNGICNFVFFFFFFLFSNPMTGHEVDFISSFSLRFVPRFCQANLQRRDLLPLPLEQRCNTSETMATNNSEVHSSFNFSPDWSAETN